MPVGEGTQIINRFEEVDRLTGMLIEGRRLVSIVGDCGIGKSTVATVVADKLMARKFWHHVYYVNLARVETIDTAAALICTAVGVPLFQASIPNGEYGSFAHSRCIDVLGNLKFLLVLIHMSTDLSEIQAIVGLYLGSNIEGLCS